MTVLSLLYGVHLLAAVFWIGGLLMFAFIVIPAARRAERETPDAVAAALAAMERRFAPLANLSLVVLIGTGMLQLSLDENYSGFLQFSDIWARAMLLKHLVVIGMVLIAGYIALVLEPERRRLETLALARRPDAAAQQRLNRRRARLAGLNLGCGLLTLLFTAIATAQ